MNTCVIVQARTGSTRFPNKILKNLNGIPVIEFLLKRLTKSQKVDRIVIATTESENDRKLSYLESLYPVTVTFGSERDVLSRFISVCNAFMPKQVVRITADCPFIDPDLLDELINEFEKRDVDYLSNTLNPTFPDGLDIEIFKTEALLKSSDYAGSDYDREHVTPQLKVNPSFTRYNFENHIDHSGLRWTIDYPEDLDFANLLVEFAPSRDSASLSELLETYTENEALHSWSITHVRNEGGQMTTGQKLWNRAKDMIPGGNMLLSKRPEQFAPNIWPPYFSAAKGVHIWDLDDNKFLDMALMGVGTNSLGYNCSAVNKAVTSIISRGNLSSLNCPEEVELAGKLIELHPWAQMARFTRSGGEANSVAVRIARVFSNSEKVAICGYHGWHDWYLAATIKSSSELKDHLLDGIPSNGVPRALKGTIFPFRYNDTNALRTIVHENKDLKIIKMEVERNIPPQDEFLLQVRQIADENGCVLIFDECTSGFRETYGGLHLKYGVNPDLAIFGKTLGNGFAINAIIGAERIMQAAQDTFISSTFWTERIGPTAALATLSEMEKQRSWETNTRTGKHIKDIWNKASQEYEIPLNIFGLDGMPTFSFQGDHGTVFKTFLTQEFLKERILATNAVYPCTQHNKSHLKHYEKCLRSVFKKIADANVKETWNSLLDEKICNVGLTRLN